VAVGGDVFKALADSTRKAILDEQTDPDAQTLFEICARLAMKHGLTSSRQTISQHLDVLEDAGLVNTRREGRYKFHHLDTTPPRAIEARSSRRAVHSGAGRDGSDNDRGPRRHVRQPHPDRVDR
jgi:DNA-binding transcriptional ArsR family regulator